MLLLSVWAACPETWTTLLLLNYSAQRSVILCIQAWKDYEKMGPWTQAGKGPSPSITASVLKESQNKCK